jgi:hypothetical protein
MALIPSAQAKVGIFDGHQDVGIVLHPGSVLYEPATRSYTIAGSGENMWFGMDDFHFVWKKVSGDVAISASIAFVGTVGDPHRKAVLMMRQTLDGPSVAVDIAVHGSGLASLQFRDAPGGNTHEVESNVSAPESVRLEKRGDFFYAFVAGKNHEFTPAGASIKVPFRGDFYAGIGVCSHNKDDVQKAIFDNVFIQSLAPSATKPVLYSSLETVAIASTDRHVEYVAPAHFEAPNWAQDGSFLIFNQDGAILRLNLPTDSGAASAAAPTLIPTTPQIHANNDHGPSPDGTLLAFSDSSSDDHRSRVYVVPVAGGAPRLITPNAPSYWHGWSPDGKTLTFTGQRIDNNQVFKAAGSGGQIQHLDTTNFDIYSIAVTGGDEIRLTIAPGLDDGPEYSPDGAYIYFNSERTGHMQIWRMHPDGSDQEEVLNEESNDWFPHISPDGNWLVYLAYSQGVTGHPADKDVEIRLMPLKGAPGQAKSDPAKSIKVLAKLVGGQGTINVPSWSPDSKRVAFVSYEYLPGK